MRRRRHNFTPFFFLNLRAGRGCGDCLSWFVFVFNPWLCCFVAPCGACAYSPTLKINKKMEGPFDWDINAPLIGDVKYAFPFVFCCCFFVFFPDMLGTLIVKSVCLCY